MYTVGDNQQQNSTSTTGSPVSNSFETLQPELVRKKKFKMPEELRGVVRDEDWVFMDIEQQKALILSVNRNPDLYLETAANQNTGPSELTPLNSTVSNNLETQNLQQANALIEATVNEFKLAKSEVINEEKTFVEKLNAPEVPVSAEARVDWQKNQTLTQEDKARIQEESGGYQVWLPKLFGFKPSQAVITQATSKAKDDKSDLNIQEAGSWLEILLRKLFYIVK